MLLAARTEPIPEHAHAIGILTELLLEILDASGEHLGLPDGHFWKGHGAVRE